MAAGNGAGRIGQGPVEMLVAALTRPAPSPLTVTLSGPPSGREVSFSMVRVQRHVQQSSSALVRVVLSQTNACFDAGAQCAIAIPCGYGPVDAA